MPHTIESTDVAGKRPDSIRVVNVQTANPKEIGLFLKSLGLHVGRQTNAAGQSFLIAQCPGLTMTVTPAAEASGPNQFEVYFTVDSLASALAAAEAQFGVVTTQPFDTPSGRRAVVADADGRHYTITEMTVATETAAVAGTPNTAAALDPTQSPFAISVMTSPGRGSTPPPIDPDELKALSAVKRGAAVVLTGIAMQLVTLLAIFTTIFSAGSSLNGQGDIKGINQQVGAYGIILLIGVLAAVAGKVTCAIPNTSRVTYAPLWTAVGLEAFGLLFNIVTAFIPDVDFMIPQIALGLLGLVAPFLFVQFLGSIMEQNRKRSVAELAKTTNSVFGFWLVSVAVSIVSGMLLPQLFPVLLFVFALASLVYAGFYTTFLIQVLTAKMPGSTAR